MRLATLARNAVLRAQARHYRPAIAVEPCDGLRFLGSQYGGWTILDAPSLQDSFVISAGLGEDASFDAELAQRYGATITMVDPTPRAIEHFGALCARTGRAAERSYVPGGCQPVEAYDLSSVAPAQLRLEPKALWIDRNRSVSASRRTSAR